jgi:hypothetical protein
VKNRLPSWRQFADNGANKRGSKVIGGRIHDAKQAWQAARISWKTRAADQDGITAAANFARGAGRT